LVEALILAIIYYKKDLNILINLSLISLSAGLFRLIFVDSNIKENIWNSGLGEYVSIFNPIFNERALIYLIAVVVSFSLAYFSFKKANLDLAKWLGIVGNLLILF
jgi:hypothetical protein